jgi:hypothetical protein
MFGEMISDASLKEAGADCGDEDAESRAVVGEVIRIRKQIANGITITITDRSRMALSPEIGALM